MDAESVENTASALGGTRVGRRRDAAARVIQRRAKQFVAEARGRGCAEAGLSRQQQSKRDDDRHGKAASRHAENKQSRSVGAKKRTGDVPSASGKSRSDADKGQGGAGALRLKTYDQKPAAEDGKKARFAEARRLAEEEAQRKRAQAEAIREREKEQRQQRKALYVAPIPDEANKDAKGRETKEGRVKEKQLNTVAGKDMGKTAAATAATIGSGAKFVSAATAKQVRVL